MRRSDSLPSISSGFVSFAFGYRLSSECSFLFPGRRTQGRPGRDYRLFPSVFSSGDGRVSQVPGEPNVCMPCSSTPAGPKGDAVFPPDVAFRYPEAVGSHENAISGLNSKAYKLPVYASRPGLLQSAQHSVPAVSTLGRTGLITRRVPEKVSALHASPSSRLGLAHQEAAFCRNLRKYHFGFVCATPLTKTFVLKEFCIRGKKQIELKFLTECTNRHTRANMHLSLTRTPFL